MNNTQEALANKNHLDLISSRIEEVLERIKAVNENQPGLDEKANQLAKEVQGQTEEIERLLAQQKKLVEKLAQENKEGAELRISQHKMAQEMDLALNAQLQEAQNEIADLNNALEVALALSDSYILKREESSAQKNQTSAVAQQILDKNNATHKALQDELEQISLQIKEAVKAAAIRRSVAHIERENAENVAVLAEKALEETQAALNEAEDVLKQRQEALEKLQKEQSEELEDIRSASQEMIAEARAAEQEAGKIFIARKQELNKVQTMVDLAMAALTTAEENKRRTNEELQSLYQQAEKETEQINNSMEEVLKKAINERNNYNKALSLAQGIEEEANNAAVEEARYTDIVSQLHIELRDLRNAALVAHNLVIDTTTAKSNSDPDMTDILLEMERALTISAEETQSAVAQKEAQLTEAEEKLNALIGISRQKQQAVLTAQKLLKEAEQHCQDAEREMYEVSTQAADRNTSKLGQLIANKRSAYEQALRETKELKLSATNSENNLRATKNEVSKAERAMTVSARNAAQTIATGEAAITEAEQRYESQINEARVLLEIAFDKREKLQTARTSKKLDLEQSRDDLQMKIETENNAIATHEELTTDAQEQIAKLKQQLNEAIQKDNDMYDAAKQAADVAMEEHEKLLRESINISDSIILYQEHISAAKEAYQKMLIDHQAQRQMAKNMAEDQEREKLLSYHQVEQELAEINSQINLVELNLNQSKKAHAQAQAAIEARDLQLTMLNQQLDQYSQEWQDISDREKQRQLREEEERRLEAVRIAEEKAKKEEEEKQKRQKEQIRVNQELEAAHIMAESVRAQEAAAQYQAKEAANEEAILLAAGKFLTKEDNLRIINSGELLNRINAISDLAREEVNRQEVRWMSKEEAANLLASAKQAQLSATTQEHMFKTAQSTYNGICTELDSRRQSRKEAGRELAGAIAAQYRAERQRIALQQAVESTSGVFSGMDDNQRALFSTVLEKVKKAQTDNEKAAKDAMLRYNRAQENIEIADQSIKEAEQSAQEAEDLLNDITNKWIYAAYQAVRLEAEADIMQYEANDREEIAFLAQQRFEAAKQAAETATDGDGRIGSVERLAVKRKKKKKKK